MRFSQRGRILFVLLNLLNLLNLLVLLNLLNLLVLRVLLNLLNLPVRVVGVAVAMKPYIELGRTLRQCLLGGNKVADALNGSLILEKGVHHRGFELRPLHRVFVDALFCDSRQYFF